MAEEHGFKNPVQIAVDYGVLDGKDVQSTDILNLVDETEKAVKVKDPNGNTAWLPKSRIEIEEI